VRAQRPIFAAIVAVALVGCATGPVPSDDYLDLVSWKPPHGEWHFVIRPHDRRFITWSTERVRDFVTHQPATAIGTAGLKARLLHYAHSSARIIWTDLPPTELRLPPLQLVDSIQKFAEGHGVDLQLNPMIYE
jgi:hypothetical protein